MSAHEILKWFWRSMSSLCQNDQTVGQQRERTAAGKMPTLFRAKPTAAVQAHLIGRNSHRIQQLAKDENLEHMHTPINKCVSLTVMAVCHKTKVTF